LKADGYVREDRVFYNVGTAIADAATLLTRRGMRLSS
jgi:hypothetical protein